MIEEYLTIFVSANEIRQINLDIKTMNNIKIRESMPPLYERDSSRTVLYFPVDYNIDIKCIYPIKRIEKNNQYLLFR